MVRLVPDEAVVVVPLVLAGAVRERRVGLRPADQALVDGEPAEHSSGSGVARDDRAAPDPDPCQRIGDLQPAGPAADHDDVVLAGREGTLV
jgi:hypothetical protein